LRAPPSLKAPITIDEILEALCELDGGPRNPPGDNPPVFDIKDPGSLARSGDTDDIRLPHTRPPAGANKTLKRGSFAVVVVRTGASWPGSLTV
jgi:hypothetical protein